MNELGYLYHIHDSRSFSINAENPHGEKGNACTASSNLGKSRKGRPCISLPTGKETELCNITGEGLIRHIWCTVAEKTVTDDFVLRNLILRIYWDNEDTPSVECPLGDFFCCGFGRACLVNSIPIVVNPNRGMNCFFQMPFKISARITVENQHPDEIDAFFYQIDYSLEHLESQVAYFHAQWRRQKRTTIGNDYVILDNVRGKGQYIGCFLAITALERYWWGEGEFKFYLDGDTEYPTLCSTGTEDYFGGAWSFSDLTDEKEMREKTFCTPYMGYPYYSNSDSTMKSDYHNNDIMPQRGLYRWHISDPIFFSSDLKITLQQIGSCHLGLFEREDDVASVAYWYQLEPHIPFAAFPDKKNRTPR